MEFNSSLTNFEKLNDNFFKAKCYVMALGKNENKSHFSKENVDRAFESLNLVPVIGHLIKEKDAPYRLGGHDVKLNIQNGFKLESLCTPFGVVVPSDTPTYEEVEQPNGEKLTYLTCDIVLWTGRYPELLEAKYNDELLFNQSMEILCSRVETLKEDEDYQDIIDFTFDALCLLNKSDDKELNVNPCFPNASVVTTYALSKSKDNLNIFLQDLNLELNQYFEQKENVMKDKQFILKKYNKSEKDLDFSISDLSIEELENKMNDLYSDELKKSLFSYTYKEKLKAFQKLFKGSYEHDKEGNLVKETYYAVEDFDESFVFVRKGTWSRDEPYSRQYFKYSYTESDTGTIELSNETEMFLMWVTLEEKEALQTQKEALDTYKKSHSYSNKEYDDLLKYKSKKEKEEKLAELSKFTKLLKTEDLDSLRKNISTYTVDDIKKECFYLIGKYSLEKDDGGDGAFIPEFNLDGFTNQKDEFDVPYDRFIKKYSKRKGK